MANVTVVLNFNDSIGGGSSNYDLPLVQSISDPEAGIKATKIDGTRGNGCIIIPAGKQSAEIRVRGILFDTDGYIDITTLMATMRSSVTTNSATLTLKYWNGSGYTTSWTYTVRRISPIEFPESDDLRTSAQPYEITFLITAY